MTVFTYRQIMELVLKYSGTKRFILSLPYWVGMIQGFFLEKLPENLFTVTRDQVSPSRSPLAQREEANWQVRQLRYDNIVSPTAPLNAVNFSSLLESFPSSLPTSSPPKADLTSVHTILPTYLAPRAKTEQGKRTHGRGSAVSPFEDIRK